MKSTWQPWGKLRRTLDGSVQIHPLLDHMTDVATVLQILLDLHSVRRAAAVAAGRPLSRIDVARLAALAFLHDIGKANVGFQRRYWISKADCPAEWPVVECGHGAQGWALFNQPD